MATFAVASPSHDEKKRRKKVIHLARQYVLDGHYVLAVVSARGDREHLGLVAGALVTAMFAAFHSSSAWWLGTQLQSDALHAAVVTGRGLQNIIDVTPDQLVLAERFFLEAIEWATVELCIELDLGDKAPPPAPHFSDEE